VDGIDGDIGARVVRINPSAQAGSRAVIAYLELEPNPALRQGLFARGTIELERRQTLQVAADAVRHDQAQPYVLRLDGSTLAQRPLRLGLRGQSGGVEAVEVLDGLAEGDRVLAGHLGAVRDGAAVRVAETQLSPAPPAASQPR
jgi:membrane fusion protein, multidrug efflux system